MDAGARRGRVPLSPSGGARAVAADGGELAQPSRLARGHQAPRRGAGTAGRGGAVRRRHLEFQRLGGSGRDFGSLRRAAAESRSSAAQPRSRSASARRFVKRAASRLPTRVPGSKGRSSRRGCRAGTSTSWRKSCTRARSSPPRERARCASRRTSSTMRKTSRRWRRRSRIFAARANLSLVAR